MKAAHRVWRLVRQIELRVLVVGILAALAIWGFIEIADEVIEGATSTIDERVMLALRDAERPEEPVGPTWVRALAHDLTAIGDPASLILLILIVTGYLLITRRHAAMWLVLIAALSGQAISSLLKHVVDRPRPDVVPHLVEVSTASFPSGHSMMSAVVFLTLGALLARIEPSRRVKTYLIGVAVILTIGIGLSRIYLGVHYPTDVVAGWLVGLSWALLCWLAAALLAASRAVDADAV